jgi:hypothetical protein
VWLGGVTVRVTTRQRLQIRLGLRSSVQEGARRERIVVSDSCLSNPPQFTFSVPVEPIPRPHRNLQNAMDSQSFAMPRRINLGFAVVLILILAALISSYFW